MAKATKKSAKPKSATKTPPKDLGETGEYHLPIEAKPGRSAGSGLPARRLMIAMALALAIIAALLVWWLGTNL